jgi:rSAM/selenodomain-associated transferase 1
MQGIRQAAAPRPAIIIFAREPVAGFTKTRLIARIGSQNAATLSHAFTLDALAKARSTGLPLVIAAGALSGASAYFPPLARRFGAVLVDQGDGSLGARMRLSLERFSNPGGALLIGTDTPSLPASFIARGARLMRTAPVVLGPSLDGGYYLVAVRGEPADIFRGVRWGGSQVLAQTLERLRRMHTPYALAPAWYDVDRWSDLLLLARHLHIIRRTGSDPCPATAKVLRQLGLL